MPEHAAYHVSLRRPNRKHQAQPLLELRWSYELTRRSERKSVADVPHHLADRGEEGGSRNFPERKTSVQRRNGGALCWSISSPRCRRSNKGQVQKSNNFVVEVCGNDPKVERLQLSVHLPGLDPMPSTTFLRIRSNLAIRRKFTKRPTRTM